MLLTFVCFSLGGLKLRAAEGEVISLKPEPQAVIAEPLINPSNIFVWGDGNIYVIDPQNPDYIVYRVVPGSSQSEDLIRVGAGPGEASGMGSKVLQPLGQDRYFFFDAGLQRGAIYDRQFQLMHTIRNTVTGNALSLFVVTDSTIAVLDMTPNNLITFYRLNHSYHLSSKPLKEIPVDFSKATMPIGKNPLLKQGDYSFDSNGLIISFTFSTILILIDNNLNVKMIDPLPTSIPFPKSRELTYQMPDIGRYPVAVLDVALDKNWIYVLFSGKQVSWRMSLKYLIKGEMYKVEEYVELSDVVYIINRLTGKLAYELKLPVKANKIEVDKNRIYVLSKAHTPPAILIYQKPDKLR